MSLSLMLPQFLLNKGMSRRTLSTVQRTQSIARHMMSTTSASSESEQPPVLFESLLSARTYKLNRAAKLNALDQPMLGLLQGKIEEWRYSDLCGVIWGSGEGRAFCAGGDVEGVIRNAANPETRHKAIDFFNKEFALDYMLATLQKPYIAIMDGITMGGGVGLSAPAPFRVATEKTVFAMPETKIGYCPDVGASHYLSRLDGELGTYLALTGDMLKGQAVYEHGLATHFIPSRRVPMLLESVSALESPSFEQLNEIIEENASEPEHADQLTSQLIGPTRKALDFAFRHNKVEDIFKDLNQLTGHKDPSISKWASKTLESLNLRSPTSLKVALRAIRRGKTKSILQALEMEYNIAAALCNGASPDFNIGVTFVLIEKVKEGRPAWSPATLEEVSEDLVNRFFDAKSPYLTSVPPFVPPPALIEREDNAFSKYALPTEIEIRDMVTGEHVNGGDTGITLDELVSAFEDMTDNKICARGKVIEVARRRCELVDNADGNSVWLRWIHNPESP